MAEKAYLIVSFDVGVVPPVVVNAEVASGPLASRTISGHGSIRNLEIAHVRGNTYEQAEAKMLRMIQGLEPSTVGDLRLFWQFVEPGRQAHNDRYRVHQQIKVTVASMPRKEPPITGLPPFITAATDTIVAQD